MPEEDRQWRRRIEQMVRAAAANASSGGDGGPHTHPESEVSGLTSDLAAKATTGHTHAPQAPSAHMHPESDVTNLAADLAAKAASAHNHDAAYAAAGHTHAGNGASPVTVQKATVDQVFTTVTLANATGLAFTVTAGQDREFEYVAPITSAALTTGFQIGFTFPLLSAGGYFHAVVEYQSSATAWTVQTLNVTATNVGSVAGALVTAAYVIAPTPLLVRIKGVIANPTAGTVALQLRSEVAGSAITLKRGATLKYA